jgi:hypothetical protein
MMLIMTLRHRLAGLFWAAILIVVVQFVPTPASAHVGHVHAAPAVQGTLVVDSASGGAADSNETRIEVLSAGEAPAGTATEGACGYGCCSSGLGCCGGAITVLPQQLPDIGTDEEQPLPKLGAHVGVPPNTLVRPPKIFA